ncbi:MAG: ribbon-helix-helix protein, CopG family [Chloroflexi bacterium]|nr:ribbon-helix-helix protein, CopG family [Chloroflexota bacterium]
MPSTTVRISDTARETLRELAARTGRSMQDVLETAIDAYRRQQFFDEVDAAFRALKESPEEWQAEIEEREAVDGSLADGLEEE